MKTNYLLLVICLFLGQSLLAQNDTLVGVLRDANEKVVKNYKVTLGRTNPKMVKTNKNGMFTIPSANLNDTLYIVSKSDKKEMVIPLIGYNFLNITLREGAAVADRQEAPDPFMQQVMLRERSKISGANILTRSDIEKTGCQDVMCLLQRLNGVSVNGNIIKLRNTTTKIGLASGVSSAMVLIDGAQAEASQLLNLHVSNIYEISVLKETAAVEYGTQGVNGVLVVKTRR